MSSALDGREIYGSISTSGISLFGDAWAFRSWASVVYTVDGYAIIRCRRGTEKEVEAAIATVNKIEGFPVALHPIQISGTIRTLKERIDHIPKLRQCNVMISRDNQRGLIYHDGRIDLKEKGFNQGTPQYITEEDIEDIYYDE